MKLFKIRHPFLTDVLYVLANDKKSAVSEGQKIVDWSLLREDILLNNCAELEVPIPFVILKLKE